MVVSNPGRVPFFMMGISHELTIQRFWGTPMTMESLKISDWLQDKMRPITLVFTMTNSTDWVEDKHLESHGSLPTKTQPTKSCSQKGRLRWWGTMWLCRNSQQFYGYNVYDIQIWMVFSQQSRVKSWPNQDSGDDKNGGNNCTAGTLGDVDQDQQILSTYCFPARPETAIKF